MLMLNVKPFRFHVNEGHNADAWIERFPDELREVLLETAFEDEWAGNAPTKLKNTTLERHGGTIWVTLRQLGAFIYSAPSHVTTSDLILWQPCKNETSFVSRRLLLASLRVVLWYPRRIADLARRRFPQQTV